MPPNKGSKRGIYHHWLMRCWTCGMSFTAVRGNAFTCKPACRKAWNRAVKAGTAKRHPQSPFQGQRVSGPPP